MDMDGYGWIWIDMDMDIWIYGYMDIDIWIYGYMDIEFKMGYLMYNWASNFGHAETVPRHI